jgi:hypothetical protein
VTHTAAGAGQLLFVDPQLLQLDDQEALGYLVKGLKVRAGAWQCCCGVLFLLHFAVTPRGGGAFCAGVPHCVGSRFPCTTACIPI